MLSTLAILERHPGLFADVAEIYTAKRNLLSRLKHCPEIRQFYQKRGNPMGAAILQPQPRDLNGGDRIRIRSGGRRLLPELVGQVGTIVEVFRVPQGSCLVRIDGDADHEREWFFYRDEIVIGDT